MGKNVLITGAGGFIGTHLIPLATKCREWNVHVVISGKHEHQFADGVIVHKADLHDSQQCESLIKVVHPELLIHLAWSLEKDDYRNSADNLTWVADSIKLLHFFHRYGGKRFVFSGSSTEYAALEDENNNALVKNECSLYGVCKLNFARIAKRYCEINNLQFVSARCFTAYGEEEYKGFTVISKAICSFLKREKFICKSPDNIWDFIYVKDVANALIEIASSDYCGIIDVGTGNPCLIRNLLDEISQIMNCSELLLYQKQQNKPIVLVAENYTLNKIINFQCSTSLRNGLLQTIDWWKKQL